MRDLFSKNISLLLILGLLIFSCKKKGVVNSLSASTQNIEFPDEGGTESFVITAGVSQ